MMNEELACSLFGCHVAASDVAPGFTFNTRQGETELCGLT